MQKEMPGWMREPSVKDIPKEKLDFLQTIYEQSQGKTQKELLAVLLPLLNNAKEKNLTLSPKELNLAVEAIKKHSTKEELNKIDEILKKQNRSFR